MSREHLRNSFAASYGGPADEMQAELERTLSRLEDLKSIRVDDSTVRLVERIIIRLG